MTCSTEPYGVTAKFGLHNKPVNAMWEFSKVLTVFHSVTHNPYALATSDWHAVRFTHTSWGSPAADEDIAQECAAV